MCEPKRTNRNRCVQRAPAVINRRGDFGKPPRRSGVLSFGCDAVSYGRGNNRAAWPGDTHRPMLDRSASHDVSLDSPALPIGRVDNRTGESSAARARAVCLAGRAHQWAQPAHPKAAHRPQCFPLAALRPAPDPRRPPPHPSLPDVQVRSPAGPANGPRDRSAPADWSDRCRGSVFRASLHAHKSTRLHTE